MIAVRPFVFDGEDAVTERYPYYVSLRREAVVGGGVNGRTHFCGGGSYQPVHCSYGNTLLGDLLYYPSNNLQRI